ncbi:MAG TPA: ABC-2 family transporter protein [Actinocrinis sp.]|nr:ABC-2 family transporter protein [Actinocrinis sp.]
MRLYLAVARLAFRRVLTYKSGVAAGMFTNSVFGFIRAYVLLALWAQKPGIGGYDASDAVTYVFLAQAMMTPLGLFLGTTELGPRVRTGDVGVDLYRPCDFQSYWFALDMGRAAGQIALRSVPMLLIPSFFFTLSLPTAPLPWVQFAISALLALVISFAIRYLVSVSAFWTMDERGMASALLVVSLFCSGFIIPITIMPAWLGTLCNALPWSATVQLPTNILLGVNPAGFADALTRQLVWALGLLALGRLATSAARHKVVVQGG